MAGFLDKAKEQAQSALAQGKGKVEEVQLQRAGQDLLRKLGAAYYAEQRGSGSPTETQRALADLEQHIAQHGDAFLRPGGRGSGPGSGTGPGTGPGHGPSTGPGTGF